MLKVILIRKVNGRNHVSKLQMDKANMHIDIIQYIIDRLLARGSNPDYIEQLLDNGYTRND